MEHFDPERFYKVDDPALTALASKDTFNRWRCNGTGPEYVRFGRRILYSGKALNDFIASRTVRPRQPDAA